MKKLISVITAVTLMLLLVSCTSVYTQNSADGEKLSIVTTIFPYYDFAKNIAGDKANVKMLLSPGNEPHDYDPSPSDIVSIENCDIFIYNGGESDAWVDGVLDSIENKNIKVLKMMDYVNLRYEEEIDHSHHEGSVDSEHDHQDDLEYDEHIWTSIKNAETLSKSIFDAVVAADSKNTDYYSDNLNKYTAELSALDNKFKSVTDNAKRDTVVFGDRFPLLYFAKDYNLKYEAAFPGCSSETEPSIAVVTHLIDFVRDNNIPVVFYLDFSNGKTAKLISEDSDAKTLKFSSCHNVTKEQFADGTSYISLMEQNLSALKEALS